MPQKRAERTIVVSGKNGYIQLLPEEQKALRIEVYFTATNVGTTNYYSYEWYKERTLYGRFKVSRGEYTSKEKLVQYQNELVYSEEATLFEIIKRLQCQIQLQYVVNKFLVEGVASLLGNSNLPNGFSAGSTSFDQIPPQPVSIPGLQMDGLYYNMFPGCAGKIVFQTWYDNDSCKDVNGNDLTRDNRGKAPDPAFTGRPPSGDDSDVPKPTYEPNNSYKDPDLTNDEPTETLENPIGDKGLACTLYTLKYDARRDSDGYTFPVQTITIYGKYGAVINRSNSPTVTDFGLYHGIDCPGISTTPLWAQLVSGGYYQGKPEFIPRIISIVQQ
jgi:hypothetical protein